MSGKELPTTPLSTFENIRARVTALLSSSASELLLDEIVQKRRAKKPVFFPDPREALALVVLPAKEFALRIHESEYEGIQIVGAAYDCLRLRDRKKAGEFLEILSMATDGHEDKASYTVAVAVAFRIKKDKVPFEDQEDFLAFSRGYGIKNVTKERIDAVSEKLR